MRETAMPERLEKEEPESPREDRLIAHVDMDAFFVSVERMDRPDLENKPVIVGGSTGRRGVVSAASYEARAFGVHSAMPMTRARELCPHAVYIEANHKKYGEASGRVMRVLGDFTPAVQAVSVDEAYLDLSGTERLHGPPLQTAAGIREAVLRETNCSASIGLASSRLVSKIASGLSKPAGILRVYPGGEAAFLRPLKVSKIPGVGRVMVEKLNRLGIVDASAIWVTRRCPFSKRSSRTWGPDSTARRGGWTIRNSNSKAGPRASARKPPLRKTPPTARSSKPFSRAWRKRRVRACAARV